MRGTTLCACLVLGGCTRPNVGAALQPPPDATGDGSQTGISPPPANNGGGGGGSGGGVGGGGAGGGGGTTMPPPCYSEPLHLGASLDAVEMAFQPGWSGNWLETALSALQLRTPGGFALLDATKSDQQLPNYADPSAFPSLMQALYTMCSGESTEWDYGHAGTDRFDYYMPPSLTVTPAQFTTFPRAEIAGELTDDATANYDGTYVNGPQGQDGFVALADDLNSETNGLLCIAAVGDKVSNGISARDGVAAQLYYLELYLRRARTAHASVYAQLQGSPDWQKTVRYEWARAHFWYGIGVMFAATGIGDARIWAHVHEPANLMEISLFTGQDPSYVACNP